MSGALLSAGTSLVSSLVGLIPSFIQARQSKKLIEEAGQLERTNRRPEYSVAPSISEMVDYSRGLTHMGDVPGGNLYRNQIQEATARGVNTLKELGRGSEVYGAVGDLVRGEQNQMRGLSQSLAGMVQQYQGQYTNTLGAQAQEERNAWQWNEADPYLMAAGKAALLRKSGLEGRLSAFSDMAGVGANFTDSLNDIDWQSILSSAQVGTEGVSV